jgi:hypothetical protein
MENFKVHLADISQVENDLVLIRSSTPYIQDLKNTSGMIVAPTICFVIFDCFVKLTSKTDASFPRLMRLPHTFETKDNPWAP